MEMMNLIFYRIYISLILSPQNPIVSSEDPLVSSEPEVIFTNNIIFLITNGD